MMAIQVQCFDGFHKMIPKCHTCRLLEADGAAAGPGVVPGGNADVVAAPLVRQAGVGPRPWPLPEII